jgi:CheY-like chemotaxis protein
MHEPGNTADGRKDGPGREGGPPSGPRRVLIVDDNVDAAYGLARLLARAGFDVEEAHDGPAAIAAAAANPPDVVLLDIDLPGMDGYEVASRLRTDVGLTAARVVAVSGYGPDEDPSLAASAGIDHAIGKPVDVDALLDLLGPPG